MPPSGMSDSGTPRPRSGPVSWVWSVPTRLKLLLEVLRRQPMGFERGSEARHEILELLIRDRRKERRLDGGEHRSVIRLLVLQEGEVEFGATQLAKASHRGGVLPGHLVALRK